VLSVDGQVWTARRNGDLLCRSGSDGRVLWTARLPFAPAWVGCQGARVLAGGPDGLAGLCREDGRRLWTFPAPVEGSFPGHAGGALRLRVVREPRPAAPLTDFRLGGDRVFCLQGGRRLFALDGETGRVVWQRWAPGALCQLPAPRGRFAPAYHVGADRLVIAAAGHVWALDPAGGRLLHDTRTPAEPWRRAPVALAEQTVGVVPDADHVALLRADTGKVVWRYTLPGTTTRSGEPPLLVGQGEVLLVVVPANIGYWLQRLDRRTGRPLWDRPQLLGLEHLDAGAWASDAEAVYHAGAGTLAARSLADGRLLWERGVAKETDWRVVRAGGSLLAWPTRTGGLGLQFRWLGAAVQWRGGPLPPASVPVLCLDPKTGRLLQRLNFEAAQPRVQVRVGAARAALWPEVEAALPAGWPGPAVHPFGAGLVVAWGNRLWGLFPPN
jgi:outer membrane protein assembly factor BamB